jgi:hypothetical protein
LLWAAHKENVSACIVFSRYQGDEQYEVKSFGTFTGEPVGWRKWFLAHDCPVAAMESTGVYRRTVRNVLGDAVAVVWVSARDLRTIPGWKTDNEDSRGTAGLLRHGLLKGGFLTPRNAGRWWDLTRLIKKYVQGSADFRKRVQEIFEPANIKRDPVAPDRFGVTGNNLMQADPPVRGGNALRRTPVGFAHGRR